MPSSAAAAADNTTMNANITNRFITTSAGPASFWFDLTPRPRHPLPVALHFWDG
jgi:hypothetical protein